MVTQWNRLHSAHCQHDMMHCLPVQRQLLVLLGQHLYVGHPSCTVRRFKLIIKDCVNHQEWAISLKIGLTLWFWIIKLRILKITDPKNQKIICIADPRWGSVIRRSLFSNPSMLKKQQKNQLIYTRYKYKARSISKVPYAIYQEQKMLGKWFQWQSVVLLVWFTPLTPSVS